MKNQDHTRVDTMGDSSDSPTAAGNQLPRVQIVKRDHPHFEEYGRFTGKVITLLGKPMAEVRLEHCQHGTDGCFVSQGDVKQVRERGK